MRKQFSPFFFQINDLQKLIQIKETETNDLLLKERELTEKFQAATNDSTFADFLKKMYNKKYKLQKAESPGGKSIIKHLYFSEEHHIATKFLCFTGLFLLISAA